MTYLFNRILDIFAPRAWTLDLGNRRWVRRVNGAWQYRPMTTDEIEEQTALWAIR